MRVLIVTPTAAAAIAAVNVGRQVIVSPVTDAQGRQVVGADLLTDCGEGGAYAAYAEILAGLTEDEAVML